MALSLPYYSSQLYTSTSCFLREIPSKVKSLDEWQELSCLIQDDVLKPLLTLKSHSMQYFIGVEHRSCKCSLLQRPSVDYGKCELRWLQRHWVTHQWHLFSMETGDSLQFPNKGAAQIRGEGSLPSHCASPGLVGFSVIQGRHNWISQCLLNFSCRRGNWAIASRRVTSGLSVFITRITSMP